MRGPRGERLGDPVGAVLGDTHRNVVLVLVDGEGVERPGYTLRAGDFIERVDYDHGRRVVTAQVGSRPPLPLRLRLRRWWEGWRR